MNFKSVLSAVLTLFTLSSFSQNAPVTSAPFGITGVGQFITLPVEVTGFDDIGALSLRLDYNPAVIQVTSIIALLPGLSADWTTNPGTIMVAWYGLGGVTLPAGSDLLSITFRGQSQGLSPLHWNDNGTSCEYAAYAGGTYPVLNDFPAAIFYKEGQIAVGRTAPVTITPFLTAVPGETISIPITVRGFSDIGAISLSMTYDPAVLTFQGVTTTAIPGTWVFFAQAPVPGRMLVAGYGPSIPQLDEDDVLFTALFTYNGGTSALAWDDAGGTGCEYADGTTLQPLPDSPQPAYYLDGNVSEQMTADFMADDVTPARNTSVSFTDLSEGNPTGWTWTFDRQSVNFLAGTNHHSQNPQVEFTEGGLYSVTLVITNAYTSESETKTAYIHAGIPGLWTGSVSSEWYAGSNWDDCLIPYQFVDVVIPGNAPNWPVYNGNLVIGVHCKSITLSSPTSVLTIKGDLVY